MRNPEHIFSDSGKYLVKLIVADTSGCRDTVSKTLYIYQKPQALYTYSNACSGLLTIFTNASKAGYKDSITNYYWDLGNGVRSNSKDTGSVYNFTGTYTTGLIISTLAGCRDTLQMVLTQFKKPTGRISPDSACQNALIDYLADTSSKALSYRWDFDDGSFFSTRNATHTYKNSGTFYPKLSVDFGSTKCTIDVDSIFIYALPDPDFVIVADTQCFLGNNVCIKPKKGNKLKSRLVVFDDGTFDNTTPLGDSVICHKYTDPKGGNYFITLEVVDSNNCLASKTAVVPVLIYPELIADFDFTGSNACFKTPVSLRNLSNSTPPVISSFKWDFGDGSFDSVNWTNFKYTYNLNGSFKIKLSIEDDKGCRDTVLHDSTIINTSFIIDARLDSMAGFCRNDNYFRYKQSPVTGAKINWDIPGVGNYNTFTPVFKITTLGIFYPTVRIQKNGCDTLTKLDSIVIKGPRAIFGSIQNRFQCQSKDTVFFTNNSTSFQSSGLSVFWDVGDPSAAKCITDSRKNINVGMNCRYSVDSAGFKHFYPKGVARCYYVKLVVSDTILGCHDSVTTPVPIMAPQAKGLFTPSDTFPCPGPELYKYITFNLNQSQPSCIKSSWWVMWDSLSAVKTGNFDSNWQFRSLGHNYYYTKNNGDSLGNVSIGLIVENGTDTNGIACRDTGWFHNSVNIIRINPLFYSNYDSNKYYCANTLLRFHLEDSNQITGSRFIWDMGDGTIIDTTSQNSFTHLYKNSGKYRVQLRVMGPKGCVADTSIYVRFGVQKDFAFSDTLVCINKQSVILENNRYFSQGPAGKKFWSDSVRTANGKELMHFDLDDGKGFRFLGNKPVISYSIPGQYRVSMAIRDSLGCWDTAFDHRIISVSGVYADFAVAQDTFLCAQSIDLISKATTYDSLNNAQMPGDSVSKWTWSFGPSFAKSFVPNPRRFFDIGTYSVKMNVVNPTGCKDSVTKSFTVIGPLAHYNFVGDTSGCEPLTVTFQNNSKFATTYIWQFNDAGKNAFGTDEDTNISHRFVGAGKFYPQLIARGLFKRAGISQICDDVYPDSNDQIKKVVTVYELPKPDFTWKTNCKTSTTTFTNTSTLDSGTIIAEQWFFGDGSSSFGPNPSHTYADTGKYRIVLKVLSDKGCEDSIVRDIVLSLAPVTNFGFKSVCQGLPNLFSDSSVAFNDRIYLWNWNFGDGTSSRLKNPSKIFPSDTVYSVKLKVTNIAGCSDSLVKKVSVLSNPKPSFTQQNVCDQSIMYFFNTSTSKQNPAKIIWDFGDGTATNNYNDSHLYRGPGNYSVKLKLITTDNCLDSFTTIVTVHPNPVSIPVIQNPVQCFKYNLFDFGDSSKIISGNVSAEWDFGDTDSSFMSNPKHSYTADGLYKIRLISVSGFNCRDTSFDSVRVYPSPKASFSINQADQCLRYNLYEFNNTGTLSSGSFSNRWETGTGDSAFSDTFKYHYQDTGLFRPLLILTSDKNCTDSTYGSVKVLPMPISRFLINDTQQCFKNNYFNFTNYSASSAGLSTYFWDFGDSTGYTGRDTAHQYTSYGKKVVMLSVVSLEGCIDSAFETIEIYPMPVSVFQTDDSLQCLTGNVFNFSNKSKLDYDSMSYLWHFGDLNSSNLSNPAHSYSSFGTFMVVLISTSNQNCTDSSIQPVTVYPMPVVKPIVNDSSQCFEVQNFVFTDSSTIANGFLSKVWKTGDGNQYLTDTLVKSYQTEGSFKVWLIQNSDAQCSDSAFINVIVYPKPTVNFSINDTGQCLTGNAYSFINLSTISSGSQSYEWKFGDASSQFTTNSSHSYANQGTYRVSLIATSTFGCKDSAAINVEVYPMPVPGFTMNQNEQCIRDNSFKFTNNSTILSGTLKYLWHFGDTGTSSDTSPVYQYMDIGNYTVRLNVTSGFGCQDSIFDFTTVNPMPQSGFTISDTTQCLNDQNFIFNDTGKISRGFYFRQWTFEEGTGSGAKTVNRSFLKDTVQKVKLVLTSDRGCKDSLTKLFEVYSVPLNSIQINDTDQCLKQNQFVFLNSTTIKKGNLTFEWDFGDGKTANSKNTNHKYFAYGNYTVKMVSISDKGCTDTLRSNVRVDPMPILNFNINDTGQCVNDQLFSFTNKTVIPLGNYVHTWKFGDGDTSMRADPVHQYLNDGFYTVVLGALSDRGCYDSAIKMVAVYPKPNPAFSVADSVLCLYLNDFAFTNRSGIKYGSMKYRWNFGDGNSDTGLNVNHSYSADGVYNVNLKATSDLNCTDSISKQIIVGPMPNTDFSINDRGQCFRSQDFRFTNLSMINSGTVQSIWHYGDGDTTIGINGAHRYKATGNYFTKLIVRSNFGCSDSITKQVWVNPNAQTSFTVNDSDQCLNSQNFIFTNTSQLSSGNLIGYKWLPGNGQVLNTPQINAVYDPAGKYTVMLETTTDSLCKDTAVSQIIVFPIPIADFTVNDSAQCLNVNSFQWTDRSSDTVGIANIIWDINGESTQVGPQANYTFGTTGFKDIMLKAISSRNCRDSIVKQVYVKPLPDPLFETLKPFYCEFTGPISFVPNTPGGTFIGKNFRNGAYYPEILWEDSVMYVVTVDGCTDTSVQLTNVYPLPDVDLGNDTALCKYETMELYVNAWQSRFVWNDGSNRPVLNIQSPGLYWVTASNVCGVASDSIQVTYNPVNCRLFLPTAFTPNDDGINDRFKPITYNVSFMRYKIYNRWGELLHDGNINDDGWDGMYQGSPAQPDAYMVYVDYDYLNGTRYIKLFETAIFVLIR
ncbi:MAG: PKD domain-containing protein [Flavobacteriales bacterium]|nr:PKD domain-containing protein [Flavobacteriales bacterium]